ncbi:exonuclease subunit SbcD [Raineya orbicola]|jgi:exonuclease SbcD|uniref:Nuclease SbcCD subunit D n=1 Tax=Raineya orbicola TaxID=2016530 RepID=A0A2N3IA61_9BACT|nr:exonuclease subunit SbcD [Raineya orbicola]PKQ67244.1 sbcd: exonuclease SbcCD, D subunit [Raineya orbicola]
MRILHTADWHLGQKLYDRERFDEFQNFLDWLIDIIRKERVDVLIVAGDIFDVASPPQKALEQYYQFLAKLVKETPCNHAIIVGGNHDSTHSLNAPQELAKILQLHIVGGASENKEHDLIEIRNEKNELQAVVAAVPFLRDKDIRYNQVTLDNETRDRAIAEAIYNHYAQMAQIIRQRGYAEMNIPLIATGHLFAQGCSHHSEEGEENKAEKMIYSGNLGKVPATVFPSIFDYVALGHLHRSQMVGGKNHIRYSGSPLPLSFSERNDKKYVLLVDFEGKNLQSIASVDVPTSIYRKLIRITGTLQEVCNKIKNIDIETTFFPTLWAEVLVILQNPEPTAKQILEKALQENPRIESLSYKIELENRENTGGWVRKYADYDLREIHPQDVLLEICRQEGYSLEEYHNELLPLFNEIVEKIEEKN